MSPPDLMRSSTYSGKNNHSTSAAHIPTQNHTSPFSSSTDDTNSDSHPSHGYTPLPLPPIHNTNIHIISHNINTLHTTTTAELSATFDAYYSLQPTIMGLQETNKNWSIYNKTEGPLQTIINRRWPGAKTVMVHCKDLILTTPYQPGGIAQFVLQQLTGCINEHGRDCLGWYAWQSILLDGS